MNITASVPIVQHTKTNASFQVSFHSTPDEVASTCRPVYHGSVGDLRVCRAAIRRLHQLYRSDASARGGPGTLYDKP